MKSFDFEWGLEDFGIGVWNRNSESEFGIGIRNRNSESEFGIGIRNRNSKSEFPIKCFFRPKCFFHLIFSPSQIFFRHDYFSRPKFFSDTIFFPTQIILDQKKIPTKTPTITILIKLYMFWDLESGTWELGFKIWNSGSGIGDWGSGTWDPDSSWPTNLFWPIWCGPAL